MEGAESVNEDGNPDTPPEARMIKAMRLGKYRVWTHNHGPFRLDGGAMFGTVPKALWSKLIEVDDLNRIPMATRSLVLDDGERRILVDVGCGDKWSEKEAGIFDIPRTPYRPIPGVTDVVLTHLHFDHAGGLTSRRDEELHPNYPAARHHVTRANLANARQPNDRERASYLKDNIDVFEQVPLVETADGQEIAEGLVVHQADGHTRGLGWLTLAQGDEVLAFPSDLIPTSRHLPLAYVMGYDICAERTLAEKAEFLRRAVEERWIVVFQHDPDVPAARLAWDERGRPIVAARVAIPEFTEAAGSG